MPELPEVETVVADIRSLAGDRLESVRVFDKRVWFESELQPEAFADRRLEKLSRRGKYIVWDFGDRFLVQHLRMTGKMLPAGSPALPAKLKGNMQIRLELTFTDHGRYYFYDTRRFGTFTAVRDIGGFWARKAQAPDSVNPEEVASALAHYLERIAGRARPIKSALLDQTILSGVGNIYADEALHREGIHPGTQVARLSRAELEKIFHTVRAIFAEAIRARGTTAYDYMTANGTPGDFAQFLRVYQRKGELCLACRKGRIATLTLAGRTSHFCPICQPRTGRGTGRASRARAKRPVRGKSRPRENAL